MMAAFEFKHVLNVKRAPVSSTLTSQLPIRSEFRERKLLHHLRPEDCHQQSNSVVLKPFIVQKCHAGSSPIPTNVTQQY